MMATYSLLMTYLPLYISYQTRQKKVISSPELRVPQRVHPVADLHGPPLPHGVHPGLGGLPALVAPGVEPALCCDQLPVDVVEDGALGLSQGRREDGALEGEDGAAGGEDVLGGVEGRLVADEGQVGQEVGP